MRRRRNIVCLGLVLVNVGCVAWLSVSSMEAAQEDDATNSPVRYDSPTDPGHAQVKPDSLVSINNREPKLSGPMYDTLNTHCNSSQCVDVDRDSVLLLDNVYMDPVPLSSLEEQLALTRRHFASDGGNFYRFMINVSLSESLPVSRPVPDIRPLQCSSITYANELEDVSIVIPYHNEAWSVFLRTVHSVMNHSPLSLLREIILVDDASTNDNLKVHLVQYLKLIPKIKLLRTKSREGLIRARMLGAKEARGRVLVFLDAHVECSDGWLEPLLSLVKKEPNTVAVPLMHYIDPKTLNYVSAQRFSYGTFSWELDYVWSDIPGQTATKESIQPIDTQTTIGCALAVNRNYFFQYGGYDEGMRIWGGENLELSFKTWMCGGAVKIVPCSNIGHVFRSNLPYSFPIEDVVYKNLQRLAMTWLDDYAQYYYLTTGKLFEFTNEEKQSIAQRKQLRQSLNCQSFGEFLRGSKSSLTRIGEAAILYGQMKNAATQAPGLCITLSNQDRDLTELQPCPFNSKQQTFMFANNQLVYVRSKKCVTLSRAESNLRLAVLEPCVPADKLQRWTFDPIVPPQYEQTLIGVDTRKPLGSFRLGWGGFGLCLVLTVYRSRPVLALEQCRHDNLAQYWVFTHQIHQYMRPKVKQFMLLSKQL